MQIRSDQDGDEQAIHDLTVIAFAPMPLSDGTEATTIRGLRADGNLTVSLVAVNDTGIVGHIAFSPVTTDGKSDGWLGLGPVSVHPDFQRTGIGTELINEGLSMLKTLDARGCALIGTRIIIVVSGLLAMGSSAIAMCRQNTFNGFRSEMPRPVDVWSSAPLSTDRAGVPEEAGQRM